jgi:hypothetical protein
VSVAVLQVGQHSKSSTSTGVRPFARVARPEFARCTRAAGGARDEARAEDREQPFDGVARMGDVFGTGRLNWRNVGDARLARPAMGPRPAIC